MSAVRPFETNNESTISQKYFVGKVNGITESCSVDIYLLYDEVQTLTLETNIKGNLSLSPYTGKSFPASCLVNSKTEKKEKHGSVRVTLLLG